MATCNHRSWRSWLVSIFSITAVFAPAIFCDGNYADAQIIPDETLSKSSSTITPNVNIQGLSAERIDGGVSHGTNLFHSFREFNVGDNQRVYFGNPTGIENILTRVTGNKVSNILGTLGVDGRANLFLLNPNGILFGKNARLDVAGSFMASTANSFLLGNGMEFSATNPQAPPLLKINLTPGLQYGQNDPSRTIENLGNLAAGQDLKLFAGNLDLQGQLQAGKDLILQADTIKVRDIVTNPFIAAAGGKLLVQGNESIDIFALNHPRSGLFSHGEMVLRSANTVGGDAHYWSGGSFRIEKLDSSLGNLFSPYDPIIRASGDVSFDNYTGASLHVLAGGSINIPGNLTIINRDTSDNSIQEKVTLSDGITVVNIDGNLEPTVDMRAGTTAFGTPEIAGSTTSFSSFPNIDGTGTSADINIGSITNNGGAVFLTNQYQANPALRGGITISAIDTSSDIGGGNVTIDSKGGITANSLINVSGGNIFNFNFSGDGGDVTLLTDDNITLNPGTSIYSYGLLGGNIIIKSNADISVNNSSIASTNFSIVPGATGGKLQALARNLSVANNAQFATLTVGNAQAGDVIIQASESVSIDGKENFAFVGSQVLVSEAEGNGGNVTIETNTLQIANGGFVSVSTFGEGNAGDLTVKAQLLEILGTSDNELFKNTGLFNQVNEASGNGGKVTINTERLSIVNRGQISAATLGSGKGGDLNVTTGQLLLKDGGQISTATFREEDAGNLTVIAKSIEAIGASELGNYFMSSGLFSSVEEQAKADGGNLTIETGYLKIADGAEISSATYGNGNAGNLIVKANEIELAGARIDGFYSRLSTSVESQAEGYGGNLNIETGSLLIKNGAFISSATFGKGNAGDLKLTAQSVALVEGSQILGITGGDGDAGDLRVIAQEIDAIGTTTQFGRVAPSGLFAEVFPNAIGNGGQLTIETERLKAADGAYISTSTSGKGNAGDLTVTAKSVELIGISANGSTTSGLFALVDRNGRGNGGNLKINTEYLFVADGAEVGTGTFGFGHAGALTVKAQAVEVVGRTKDEQFPSTLFASVEPTAEGNGGNLNINTERLLVADGADVSVTTFGKGNAGDLTITAQSVEVIGQSKDGYPSLLSAEVAQSGIGDGGRLTIETEHLKVADGSKILAGTFGIGEAGNINVITNTFEATNGGQFLTTTSSNYDAGNIILKVRDKIILSGSQTGLFANTTPNSIGKGGSISIDPRAMTIEDGAKIAVDSQGKGDGGNIQLAAGLLTLDNGSILAETNSSTGGNITLNLQELLLLRNASQISTSAGRDPAIGTGDGGNIFINSPFIAAVPTENSNISANASLGNGGQVNITTQGIFGIKARSQPTETSDITASSKSGVQGFVTINTPDVDPARGLVQLPSNLVDASGQIASGCTPRGQQASRFIATGRGGLPQSPDEPLRGRAVITDWVNLPTATENATAEVSSSPQPIIEAQKLTVSDRGDVMLVAQSSQTNYSHPSAISCNQ